MKTAENGGFLGLLLLLSKLHNISSYKSWACPGLKESVNLDSTSSRRGNQDAERATNLYERSLQDAALGERIAQTLQANRRIYGRPRIHAVLRRPGGCADASGWHG